jgi:M6 family metalloprotease-like protein
MNRIVRTGSTAGIAFSLMYLGLGAALGLEPPTREQITRYIFDGSLALRIAQARAIGNHRMPARTKDRLAAKLRRLSSRTVGRLGRQDSRILAPPPAWQGMPTLGNVKILALLISFEDQPSYTAQEYVDSRLFADGVGGPPFDSLRNFYRRSSYNQLEISGDVLGWYQAPYARSTVPETDQGRQNLIKEALDHYDALGHDFSQYDNDGDGAIDYLCVFWTGPRGEWATFWWGYFTWFADSSYRLDGKRLTNYSWQWELATYPSGTFSPSVIIHETGHALGVPDYYDYDDAIGPRGGVGGLDIMDRSGDHGCFSKFMLGWIDPTVVSGGSQTVTLRASGLFPDAVLFVPGAVSGRVFDEYFMVQNRNRTGNDTGLFTRSDGLVVWHVDARLDAWNYNYLYDNSYTDHKLLRLMEADGLEEIETSGLSADAGDYYNEGMTFGPVSFPNSARYSGLATAMGITAITGSTTPMSLTVFSSDAPPAADITNLGDGQTVYGTVPVEVSASDDNGVTRVELYVDAALKETLAAPPFSFLLDTSSVANGAHTIRAVAYDTILQAGSDSVAVTMDNIFPPLFLEADKTVNRSLLLKEWVVLLSWRHDSRNLSVTKYRVYRVTDGVRTLIAEIPFVSQDTYRYLHRGVSGTETYTYDVVGVGSLDREGAAVRVTAR